MRRYEREKIRNFFFVIKTYFISSGVLWLIFFLLFWLFLYDPNYGKASSFSIFYDFSFFLQTILVWCAGLLFSVFVGLVLCTPIVIVKIFLHYKLQARLRQGPKPFFLFGIEKYLPTFVFLLVHFGFLFVNISLVPGLAGRFFSSGNIFYRLTNSTHYFLFHGDVQKIQSDWVQVAQKGLVNQGTYFFFVPAATLAQSNAYLKTKSLLRNMTPILLTNPSKQAAVSSLLHLYDETNIKLFVPEPIDFQSSIPQNETFKFPSESLFIGINAANAFVFSWGFPQIEMSNRLNATWFSVFMNRMAMAMPEFMLFFKMGLGHFFHATWKWENIENHNVQLLSNYAKTLLQKTTPTQQAVFFLTGQEKETERKLISIPRHRKMNTKEDENDLALSAAITGLLSHSEARVVLLPYAEEGETVRIENAYSNTPLSSRSFLIYDSILPVSEQNSTSPCYVKNMGLSFSDKKSIHSGSLLDVLKQRPDGKSRFNPSVAFLVQDSLKFFFVCLKAEEAPTFVVQKKDVYPSDTGEILAHHNINALGALFSNHEYQVGAKSAKFSDLYLRDEKENDTEAFFKSFLVFKNIPFEKAFSPREKESFLKENGNMLMSELYSKAHLQLR